MIQTSHKTSDAKQECAFKIRVDLVTKMDLRPVGGQISVAKCIEESGCCFRTDSFQYKITVLFCSVLISNLCSASIRCNKNVGSELSRSDTYGRELLGRSEEGEHRENLVQGRPSASTVEDFNDMRVVRVMGLQTS